MYVQLYQIKKHLNIDDDFHDDDEYLMDLANAAESAVELTVDVPLVSLEGQDHNIPAPLSLAVLNLVATWYANRESVAVASMSKVPHQFEYLVGLYKNYDPEGTCKQAG